MRRRPGCRRGSSLGPRTSRTTTCLACAAGCSHRAAVARPRPADVQLDPGASLEREYAKRVAARDQRVRERHPRLGGFLLAVTSEPASTRVFAQGAEGERRVAAKLEQGCTDVLFLHNRRLGPTSRSGDLDHLAVAPSGVWVIDAKHYPGAKVGVEISGGLFGRPRREKLVVGGRDRTSLVAGLTRQHEAVSAALASYDVPVRATFCFVGADLPWLRVPEVNGFAVRDIAGVRKQLRADGPLDAEARQEIWEALARAFARA
ncbi:MAG: nuclease-related domain-containing protein [Nocardioides sp.]